MQQRSRHDPFFLTRACRRCWSPLRPRSRVGLRLVPGANTWQAKIYLGQETSAVSGLSFGVAELARVPRFTGDFGSVATSATHLLSLEGALAWTMH